MWTYCFHKRREAGESTEAGATRLRALPGVIAVDAFDERREPEIAGRVYVAAFPERDADGHPLPRDTRAEDDFAHMLIDHPEALPADVRMVWFDDGGVLAAHLRDDIPALDAARARVAEKAESDAREARANRRRGVGGEDGENSLYQMLRGQPPRGNT